MSVRQYGDDRQATARLLKLLQDGNVDARIAARKCLAGLFEQRGEFERAAELLIMNARDGAGGALTFFWLERLYRAQGDVRLATRAAAEAAKYLPPKAKEPRIRSILRRVRRSARGDGARAAIALTPSDVPG